MDAVAERARVAERPARPRSKLARRRVAGGVAWIVVVAVLLAGVVFMNVAVLRLNLRTDELGRQRAKLRAENAALASRLSHASAAAAIQATAHEELGLVPADPAETTYVRLGR